MEVVLFNNSVRVKAKNKTFIIDPSGKIDSDVVVLTDKSKARPQAVDFIIDGPGEYEIAGVSIKGEKKGERTIYDFFEENQRILIFPSTVPIGAGETEGYTAAVILMESATDKLVSDLSSEIVIVAGNSEFLPSDTSNIKKTDRVNLKKGEEYKGSIVHLSK